jgi:hypothetical protein
MTAPMLPFTISEAISETDAEPLTVGTGILAIEPIITLDDLEGFSDVSLLIFTISASNVLLCLT